MAYQVETVDAEEMAKAGAEDRLDVEGTYHFYVSDIVVGQMAYKDTAIDGFSVKAKVVEGEQKNKEIGLTFFNDSKSEKGTAMARKKIAAFFIATNVMPVTQKGGEKITIDEQVARNQQFIAELRKNDEGYLQLHYANVYHVDDPRVKDVPKNAEALKALEAVPGLRKPAEYFEPLLPKKKPSNGAASGAVGAGAGTATATAAPAFDSSGL